MYARVVASSSSPEPRKSEPEGTPPGQVVVGTQPLDLASRWSSNLQAAHVVSLGQLAKPPDPHDET